MLILQVFDHTPSQLLYCPLDGSSPMEVAWKALFTFLAYQIYQTQFFWDQLAGYIIICILAVGFSSLLFFFYLVNNF